MTLDPTLDVVFKLLLTRAPALLRDMLEGVLARPIGGVTIADPELLGEHAADKRVIFDVRAQLDDGTRIDVEMQRRIPPALVRRLVYYSARDYARQLRRGDRYHLLAPSHGIIWLTEPLCPELERLHSVIELRDRDTGTRFSDQLAIHLLQLPYCSRAPTTGYTAEVHRWARFLVARSDAERDRLAKEHPIMTLAKQTLEQLSQDPEALELALIREDEIKLYEMQMRAAREEAKQEGWREGQQEGWREGQQEGWREGQQEGRLVGRQEGQQEGRLQGEAALLLKMLGLRFGPPPEAIRRRVESATIDQLEAWAERLLTAQSVDEVLGDP